MPTNVVMLVRCEECITETELRELRTRFMSDLSLSMDDFYLRGPLTRVTNAEVEAIPADDQKSEWFGVNLWKSYYGPGYERGDPRLFVKVAEWLEQNIRNCEVYYGNDSTADQVQLFDKETRASLLDYYSRRS